MTRIGYLWWCRLNLSRHLVSWTVCHWLCSSGNLSLIVKLYIAEHFEAFKHLEIPNWLKECLIEELICCQLLKAKSGYLTKWTLVLYLETTSHTRNNLCQFLVAQILWVEPHKWNIIWNQILNTMELKVKARKVCKDCNLSNRGTLPETTEILTHICSSHSFFPLSSVQIHLIPACCLLCVL